MLDVRVGWRDRGEGGVGDEGVLEGRGGLI